ncbi:MAG: YqeG family HAD IIIA-type phosphatase [Firmicutes bacterium]|nr:YqeG family HAD IIIA-type phosphatase [Bacillota bacterium]
MRLRPDLFVASLLQIDVDTLAKEEIKGVLCDLDNTMLPYNEMNINQALAQWVNGFLGNGFRFAIVSNNHVPRVLPVAEALHVAGYADVHKPFVRILRDIIKSWEIPPKQIAVIGDQLFTDVMAGNRLGCYTVLVTPLTNVEFAGTRLMRIAERRTLQHMQRTYAEKNRTATNHLG